MCEMSLSSAIYLQLQVAWFVIYTDYTMFWRLPSNTQLWIMQALPFQLVLI